MVFVLLETCYCMQVNKFFMMVVDLVGDFDRFLKVTDLDSFCGFFVIG